MRAALLFLVFLLMISSVDAAIIDSYDAAYTIVGEKALAEISLSFRETMAGFEFRIPADAEAVEVKGADFDVYDIKDYKKLDIKGEFGRLDIKFISGSMVESGRDSFFVLDISSIEADKKSLSLKLPEEAALKYRIGSYKSSLFPNTDSVRTDGRSLTIEWDNEQLNESSGVFVIYAPKKGQFALLVIAAIVIISASIVAYFTASRKIIQTKNSKKADMAKNLFEEEKEIVELLIDSGSDGIWQKQIILKTGLSKVKLSRKLRSLEQKGLIEKIPYGNTNRIRLK